MILFTLVLIVNLWKAGLEGFDHLRTKVDHPQPSRLGFFIISCFIYVECDLI